MVGPQDSAYNSANPATGGFAVVPSDTVDFSELSRALYIGGAGNLVVVMQNGNVLTFVGVPAGTVLPVRASRVNSTSTTATNIVALV